ncbi:hypothetical protein GQ55_4G259600 [Panicum hallii var. hallii]|uniref:Uncharacterized protein n=2 Tax=Panicum hallii TaxID=206008 RepID=A0A2T7E090_9POAL|nr:hypothetical protein PAHAL_4G246000 [Panicum hallii]PUZ61236.1 hypothetical protein GQ55_4G259600 [Panicum hallii var. hallii]PUZ61237.1 hypothetical protein GQ55_4G259600 [Panicum hallii var. hallii]PUZ61238.1 hypothetical protein GQ55_4G259600 [Panicum hallii var. hallii]
MPSVAPGQHRPAKSGPQPGLLAKKPVRRHLFSGQKSGYSRRRPLHVRSFAGNGYNHWLTEYEKDVERNYMLAVHIFTILPVLWFTLISAMSRGGKGKVHPLIISLQ